MGALRATFRSLSTRNVRLFFCGQLVSVVGTWLQKAAQAWLVLELTGSGTWLGVIAALQQLPTLVMGLWGGLLADRLDKRRLLLATQSVSVLPAVALGVLTTTGTIQLWMVLVLAFTLGSVEAMDRPARHAFVSEIVGRREDLINAVTLNNVVLSLGKVVGPAVAGLLIAGLGLPMTFYLNAASFGGVIIALVLVRPTQQLRVERVSRRRGQILEGLRYVRATPHLLGPLALMAVSGTLAYEFAVTIPLLAYDTFGSDARVFGFMYSAMGLGAVVGGVALAGLLRASISGLVAAAMTFAAIMALLAAAPTLTIATVLLFLLGAASTTFRAVTNSHIQLTSDPQMRGRAMALLVVATAGTTPIGGPLVGWIGEVVSPRIAFAIGGLATAAATLVMVLYLRRSGGDSTAGRSTLKWPHGSPADSDDGRRNTRGFEELQWQAEVGRDRLANQPGIAPSIVPGRARSKNRGLGVGAWPEAKA